MTSPLLSIGMIVKDEIRCLERCLKALAPLRAAIPCELVIADTGSSDGTREVAARYADQVFDYTWTNDFSAARNAVLERCSGAWYLSIDADEYLDPNISQLVETLRGGIKEDFCLVAVRNYMTTAMEEGDCNTINGMRLFRTGVGIRYEGIIHEVPVPTQHGTQPPTAKLLDQTVLHHDGYAMDLGAHKAEKMERNIVLLREALRQNPHDLRVIMQCVESSGNYLAEQIGYVYRGMEELLRNEAAVGNNGFIAPFWRHAICEAVKNDLPQLSEWLAWGEQHFLHSMFLRIDAAFFLQSYYYNHSKFQEAQTWGETYLQGLADYKAGRYDRAEEVFSTIRCIMPSEECQSKVVMAATLHHLGQDGDAVKLLTGLEPDRYNASLLRLALVTLRDLHRVPETAERAEILCAPIIDRVLADSSETAQERRALCDTAIPQFFREGDWGLFRAVSGDIGVAAQTMEQCTPEKIGQCLTKIKNWEKIPDLVLVHALEHNAPLPEAFFHMNAEETRNIVATLSQTFGFARMLTHWSMPGEDSSLAEMQFYFDLVAAGIRIVEKDDSNTLKYLTTQLIELARRYFPALYQDTVLDCTDNWSVLPGLHRFGLYLLRAQAALDQGDALECAQALRAGLATAPAMKPAADCMLKRLEQNRLQKTSPELMELANKVREILAQYLPDDPAVVAIKQSEAYQKVAYLIEGMDAPVFGGLPQ